MTTGLPLLDHIERLPPIHFRGESYDVLFDCKRLNGRQQQVHDCMIDGAWRTLREIECATGVPRASASARLRDFNNHAYLKQFFVMESRRRGDPKLGIWEYQVRKRGK